MDNYQEIWSYYQDNQDFSDQGYHLRYLVKDIVLTWNVLSPPGMFTKFLPHWGGGNLQLPLHRLGEAHGFGGPGLVRMRYATDMPHICHNLSRICINSWRQFFQETDGWRVDFHGFSIEILSWPMASMAVSQVVTVVSSHCTPPWLLAGILRVNCEGLCGLIWIATAVQRLVPSQHTKSYGKSHFFMGKSSNQKAILHSKLLACWRVNLTWVDIHPNKYTHVVQNMDQ
jgi:hypothetical protein